MAQRQRRVTTHVIRDTSPEPKTGARVHVAFGRRGATGTVVGKTVTGRYTVQVEVEGSDEPVTTSYAREDISTL